MTEVDRSGFWELLYQQGTTGWDLGGPTPALAALLAGPDAPRPGKMVVPGCGRGYDAVLFARHGFEVVGVDHAPSALADAQRLAREAGVTCTFVQEDLFALPERYPQAFDYVLEYTCFCAINPQRREEYVQAMAGVLRTGGELVGLFFPVLGHVEVPVLSHVEGPALSSVEGPPGFDLQGPPFPMSEQEVREVFSARFAIEQLAPTAHTISPRRGKELLGRMKRKS